MASHLPRPASRTASTCVPQTARGTHVFEVAGYSLHRGVGAGNFIRSAAFDVGGHSWCIRFYPDGYGDSDSDDNVAVFLELLSPNAEVRAHYDLRLVDRTTGLSASIAGTAVPQVFDTIDAREDNAIAWGTEEFIKRGELEESVYLIDDCLVVECDVTVIKEPRLEENVKSNAVKIPPSELSSDFACLLKMEDGADVTFLIRGERFCAHKVVLKVRSPVFMEELFHGLEGMNDSREWWIAIEDMQPDVFWALLHFIYTDSLPSMDDLDDHEKEEMVKDLSMAACRYHMMRLEMMCKSILSEILDAKTMAAALARAEDPRRCNKSKEVAVKYIKSSSRGRDVQASQWYEHLKRSWTAIFLDFSVKATKLAVALLNHKKLV
ncbi:hypothetical protein ACP4OV_027006 [Aristida adscensionis]